MGNCKIFNFQIVAAPSFRNLALTVNCQKNCKKKKNRVFRKYLLFFQITNINKYSIICHLQKSIIKRKYILFSDLAI